ncbi:hypothetical protein ACVW0I_004944 [Bradyrhizobium sp. LM6.11]
MHLRRLILSACFLVVLPASYALAGAETALGVAMDDFSYTDTSAEPANQTAAHERRLSAFMAALRRDIGEDRRYRLVPSAQDGAAFKVIGGIQKTSTLVQWAKVAVIDVGARKVVMDKLYTFLAATMMNHGSAPRPSCPARLWPRSARPRRSR